MLPGSCLVEIRHRTKDRDLGGSERVLTITTDNRTECADHRDFGEALGSDRYFARPYHSRKCGLNEDTNGLTCQYFGRTERLPGIAPEMASKVAGLLNQRPRMALGFRTTGEVFNLADDDGGPRLEGAAP